MPAYFTRKLKLGVYHPIDPKTNRSDDGIGHHLYPEEVYEACGYAKGQRGWYYLACREATWDNSILWFAYRLTRRDQYNCSDWERVFKQENTTWTEGLLPPQEAIDAFVAHVNKDRPHRLKRPKDSIDAHRSRCYRWEANMDITEKLLQRLNKDQVRDMVKMISADMGLKEPSIRFSYHGSCSWAMGGHKVSFHFSDPSRGGRVKGAKRNENPTFSPKTVIHEMAHIAVHQRAVKTPPGHGPEFVGLYITMLAKYADMDADSLRVLADRFELPHNASLVR